MSVVIITNWNALKIYLKIFEMRSNNCPPHTIYNYSRKCVGNLNVQHESEQSSPRDDIELEIHETATRSGGWFDILENSHGCSCNLDEGGIANILHKKCPVITLAQQQLDRLLIEGDRLMHENSRCRSFWEFYTLLKEIFLCQDRYKCIFLMLLFLGFLSGLLIGAASCGTYLGRFNSPILTCIDNYFLPDTYGSLEDSFRAIA